MNKEVKFKSQGREFKRSRILIEKSCRRVATFQNVKGVKAPDFTFILFSLILFYLFISPYSFLFYFLTKAC